MADMDRQPNEGWDFTSTSKSGSVQFAKAKQSTFKRPDWEYGVAGQRACIPSYCAGVPNHMVYMDDTSNRNAMPIVRIYADIGATVGTHSSAMINKGSAVVALVDQIEQAGQRVELIACQRSETRGCAYDEQHVFITVKAADELLDLDRVAFAMAHPSMLRRINFRIMEFLYPEDVDGYGSVRKFDDLPDDAMYIPPMYGDKGYADMDEALATVQGHWEKCAANSEAA